MGYRNRARRSTPCEITAKFDSKCKETGKTIKKGDACIYYPSDSAVYALDSQQAKSFYENQFDEQQTDQIGERLGLVGMYEYHR